MKLFVFLIIFMVAIIPLPAAMASVIMGGSHDAFVAGAIASTISLIIMLFVGSLQDKR